MAVIALTECPENSGHVLSEHFRDRRWCSACGRYVEAVRVEYVPAGDLRGAVDALRGVLAGRVIRDETEDGTPILLDLSTDPATPIRFDRFGGQ